MNKENYLEESVACYQLGRAKSTLRKYAREGKIRYQKDQYANYLYNEQDIKQMLNQRLQRIIKKHSLTSDVITKVFLDTALLLMKQSQKNIFIVFYPNNEKVNYQILFEDELKNIKQNHHVLDFNKFISDGKHGSEENYQVFATDVIDVAEKLNGVRDDVKTPKDKIYYHLKLRRTLENFISLKDERSFNANGLYHLFLLRRQLISTFDDDFIENKNIEVGFIIDFKTKSMSKHVFALSENTLKYLNKNNNYDRWGFKEVPDLCGTIDKIWQRLKFENYNSYGNAEKIEQILNKYHS